MALPVYRAYTLVKTYSSAGFPALEELLVSDFIVTVEVTAVAADIVDHILGLDLQMGHSSLVFRAQVHGDLNFKKFNGKDYTLVNPQKEICPKDVAATTQ